MMGDARDSRALTSDLESVAVEWVSRSGTPRHLEAQVRLSSAIAALVKMTNCNTKHLRPTMTRTFF